MAQCLESEDFPPCGKDELFHVFAAHLESSTGNARDYFEMRWGIERQSVHAERPEMLTRVILSRAVPSSSVSFASITICGLNSSGMINQLPGRCGGYARSRRVRNENTQVIRRA